ncbi:MAG TPA: FGGY family carbohydrate kinase [Glycomyces sp.]|nr:FGGY family carbohydrate kinase [Glycomyces sp.]
MPERAYLGVDVGTSSSKGVLVGDSGRVLGTAVRSHAPDRPGPGRFEMDARVWWDEFASITEELTTGRDVRVGAVGVSGMGPCVLVTDERGAPIRPAILYGVDTRATAQIRRMTERLGAEEILRRGGSPLTSQSVGPKLEWIAEHEPESLTGRHRLFMPASYLVHRLTGAYVLDRHSASQSSPLFDRRTLDWNREWAAQIAPWLDLPELLWSDAIAGRTLRPVGGVAAGTPVIAGTIDAWSEAASVGADRPGDLMIMYGTTMFLVATTREPLTDPRLWGTAGTGPGAHSLAGGLATSGAVTAWLRDLFGGPDFAELIEEAGRSGPGARGVLLLPYLAGERTPVFDPLARGTVTGLTLAHGRGDLYRAALEGTAFAVRHNIEVMREAGVAIERAVAVGGGTRGGLWTRVVSDVTGLEQQIPSVTVGASLGAAYLAARGDGMDVDIGRWNPITATVAPDPAVRGCYEERYRLYRRAYPALAPVMHGLATAPGPRAVP